MSSRILAGRYELGEEIGRGGMGIIYRAYDPVLDRSVAVKRIPAARSDTLNEERLEQEARLVARLDHPAIVPIFDFGRQRDGFFFVMPLVDGTPLQTLLRERSLSLGETLELVAQAAAALDYTHRQGVIHRDIKPENLMVNREPGDLDSLRLRLMDFGLATGPSTRRRSSSDNELPGTLAYLSPEQVLSQPIDGRTDLYALGVVLYESLAGEAPFLGTTASVLYRIVHEDPRPLSEFCEIDPELERWIEHCLAKKAVDRPSSGLDLARGLRRYLRTLGDRHHLPSVSFPKPYGASGSPARLPFLGRRREVDLLQRHLQAALMGECRLVLIGGEFGIGKTRLIGELEALARTRGIRVLCGRCAAQEEVFPYQGIGELFQDFFRGDASTQVVPSNLGELAVDLIEIFPALGEVADWQIPSSGRPIDWLRRRRRRDLQSLERRQIFERLAMALARLADGDPLVLLLENLHEEMSSCEALAYIARRLGPLPILIAASYTPTGIESDQHPLWMLRQIAEEDPRWAVIDIRPLSREAHRQVVLTLLERRVADSPRSAVLAETLAQEVYEATAGNPFLTQELVRSLVDAGSLTWDESGEWNFSPRTLQAGESLPKTVQQVISARLDRVTQEENRVLCCAAIIGRSFEDAGLQALLGPEFDLDGPVESLLQAGWFEEQDGVAGERMSFASRMVQEALYETVPRRRRKQGHQRYAEFLLDRYQDRLETVYRLLVHHFTAAGRIPEALEYALHSLRFSLETFGAEDAIQIGLQALRLVEQQDGLTVMEEGEIRWLLARAYRTRGDLENALLQASQAVRSFEALGEEARAAEVAVVAVESAWQGRRVDATRLWVRKGIDLARRAKNESALHELLILAATVANLRGETRRARRYWDEAERLTMSDQKVVDLKTPRGGHLTSSLLREVRVSDPGVFATSEDHELLGNLFEPLLRRREGGQPVPNLALSWESRKKSTSFLVKLRSDVRFSDGTPLTALSVKTSLMRTARETGKRMHHAGERMPEALKVLVGMPEFSLEQSEELEGVIVRGALDLEFKLRESLPIYPIFLTDLRAAIGRVTPAGELIGTGPFRMVEKRPGRILLERHPDYWQPGKPALDRLEFKIGWPAEHLATALRSGELDLARYLNDRELEGVLSEGSFRTRWVEATKSNVHFLLLNGQGPACRHHEVRRALCGVVQPHHLIWRTLGRMAEPATSWMPPGVLGHDPGRRSQPLGLEQARILLDQVEPRRRIRLRVALHPIFTERYSALWNALLDLWARIGIECEIVTEDLISFRACYRESSEIDLLMGRWFFDYDDPDDFAHGLLHSREGLVASYLVSDRADADLERARQENDPGRRQQLYQRAEDLLVREAQLLPLFHDVDCRIAGPRVCDIQLLGRAPFVDYAKIGKRPADERSVPARALAGTLDIPLPGQVAELDPLRGNLFECAEVIPNVFETLTRVERGARVIPHLAKELRMEEGGKVWRCFLRPDVRFHDGRRLTTRDVRFSLERLLSSRETLVIPALSAIRGSGPFRERQASEIAGLTLVSQHEMVFSLDQPLTFFPALLSHPTTAILPEGITRFTGSWRDGCAGTGPFRLLKFGEGKKIELGAFPQYWRAGLPQCERLVFHSVSTSEEIRERFYRGELTLAAHLNAADLEKLHRHPEFVAGYSESPGFSTYFLAFGQKRGLFTELEARRALIRELELDRLVLTGLGRHEIKARGLLPPGFSGYERNARYEAQESVSPRSFAGVSIKIALHPAYEQHHAALWAELRGAFERLGIDLKVIRASASDLLQWPGQEVDLFATRRFAGYPDADHFVSKFSQEDLAACPFQSSSEITELIERGRSESDPSLRHAIYSEIEARLARDAYMIPLFHEQVYRFARPEVRNLRLRFGWPVVVYEELSLAE